VDDREDVWANAVDNDTVGRRKGEPPINLLLVKPYHHQKFRGYAEVNNAAGEDLTASSSSKQSKKEDAAEDDDLLYWTNDILRRAHHRYFLHISKDETLASREDNELTVSNVLKQMRKEVLRGCYIVLSGLIPVLDQKRSTEDMSQPRPHALRYAEDLGATVSCAPTET
jgi:hypothetical protein